MPDTLKGNLAQLSLAEILKLLVAGRQSGRLDLRDGSLKGEIYLREGNLVHAVTAACVGEAALHALTGWARGDFDFAVNAASPEDSIAAPTEKLLVEAAQRAEDWRAIKQVVSSTDAVFRLSSNGTVSAVSLQPEEWRVLAHVNGSTSVAEIARLLNQDEFTVAKVICALAKAGLLEAGEKPPKPPSATINGPFFSKLNDEFVEIIGPIGPTIIDEAVAALGERRDSFPREKVAALVERMSADISSEAQRVHFQQVILQLLKKV